MSTITDIPQIASFDLANIQNDLHIGYSRAELAYP